MAGRGDIKAGGAYIALGMKDAGLLSGLASARAHLASTAKAMALIGVAGVGAAAAIGGTALKAFMETGSALDDMSQRTGLSVEALGELGHAAKMSGTDMTTLEGAIAKMQKGLGSGEIGGAMAESLKELGLNAKELQGMSPDAQFSAISKAIGGISDPTKKAALAMQFFGKSGAKLIPMMGDLEGLRKEARDLGFVMSGEGAANAAKLGDQLDTLWDTVKFGAITIGEILAPAIMGFIDVIQPAATAVLKWMQTIRDALLSGQIALAGQIAFKTFQVLVMKEITMMTDLVGGAIGDFIGSFYSKLYSGDFTGAWQDAVAGMLEVWSHFSSGIVDMFASAASGVLQLWQQIEDKITDFILKNASEGGIFGKLALAGTGVDMAAEVERGKKLDAQLRARGVDPGKDTLSQAQADARGITAGSIDKMNAAIEGMREIAAHDAEEASRNRASQTGGGANRAQDTLARLVAELDALKAQINNPEAAQGAGAAGDDKSDQVAGLQGKVSGTFSAAAAMAMGGAGSRSERLLGEIKKSNDEVVKEQVATRRAIEKGGLVYA